MSETSASPVVEVKPPDRYEIGVVETKVLPVVEVEVRGIQGPPGESGVDKPLLEDPLEIYLKARGDMENG